MSKKLLFLVLFFFLFPLTADAATSPEIAVASAMFKPSGDLLVTTKNVGVIKTLNPVTVGAYWFDVNGEYLYKTDFKTVAPVDVNTYSQITIPSTQVPKNATRVIFYADPANEIKEVDEWNNEFNFVFPVAKFEATNFTIINGDITITVKNVGQQEYKPESCTFCIGKKFARVVWRSADALQELSDVLETSLIPAPLGPDASTSIQFTKYIPKNATFLVVDVYQYNTEDWMNNVCVMCDSLKESPTRMFIPIAKRADLAVTGVSFDSVSGEPVVTIKNISEIPFEMENAGEISWAYFYEDGEMQNSKFEKMNFFKNQILPGISFDVSLPKEAKLSYGVSRMMVVYDTSSFFNSNSGKIINENVVLYNKEIDVKNNIWIGDVPQPDVKIKSATLENNSLIRLSFVNKGGQSFELCGGFSLCGKKIDIEYFNKDGKIVAKNQGTLNSSIKPNEVYVQDFSVDGSVTISDISLIRITHDFGSETPSEKNGHMAYVYITDDVIMPLGQIVEPTMFETFANNFKMLFALSSKRKTEVVAERIELLQRKAAFAEQRHDVEKFIQARSRLQSVVMEFSELKKEDGGLSKNRTTSLEVRRLIESPEVVPTAEIILKDELEKTELREVKKERTSNEVREVENRERVEVKQQIRREVVGDIVVGEREIEVERLEQQERVINNEIPDWQKFRQEQIGAIDKAYSEVIARKNRLTSRENTRISAEWSTAHNLFERARRAMSEYTAVERQQDLFTRVQIDAARQLKIMDELVH